jgi:hypothetical protein
MGDSEILKSKIENSIDYHDGFVYTQHRVTVEKIWCWDRGGCLRSLISTPNRGA